MCAAIQQCPCLYVLCDCSACILIYGDGSDMSVDPINIVIVSNKTRSLAKPTLGEELF